MPILAGTWQALYPTPGAVVTGKAAILSQTGSRPCSYHSPRLRHMGACSATGLPSLNDCTLPATVMLDADSPKPVPHAP